MGSDLIAVRSEVVATRSLRLYPAALEASVDPLGELATLARRGA